MGGDMIDYDMNFKLFLMTKLYNPHFRPEIAAQCTIINFIVTESGLEEQLLAQVVNQERNELETKKQELVKLQNDFSVRLELLENNLLEALASADPSTILDNKALIENLDTTKRTTVEIQEQSEKAKITEIEINTQREIYRPVAGEGAMLYFLVIQLNVMEFMYQYSLEAFTTFFFKAINKTEEKGEERIPALILKIRFIIYQWISRGLFERHKLIFLTLITFRLMIKKLLPEVAWEVAEMDFLIKCGT
jgi:dynein heavy chain, axonemal